MAVRFPEGVLLGARVYRFSIRPAHRRSCRAPSQPGAWAPPVDVTENGGAFIDVVGADGRVDDQDRIAYYRDYLAGLQRAISEGADVRGFMPWSLLDNFEGAHGDGKRFGLAHVDYRSQKRTPKASFDFMRKVIAANALPGV